MNIHTQHRARLFTGWLANRPNRGRAFFPAPCAAKTGPHHPVRPTFALRSSLFALCSCRFPLPASLLALPASRLALAAFLFALCACSGCRTYYITTNVYGLENHIETKIPVDKTIDLNATVIP